MPTTAATNNEITFYDSGGVTVTNARFIVGAETFAMRNITSVKPLEITPSLGGPTVILFFGLALLIIAIANHGIGLGIIAVVLCALGVILLVRRKSDYSVILHTAGGELTAYTSRDRQMIVQIVAALNEAIVSHS